MTVGAKVKFDIALRYRHMSSSWNASGPAVARSHVANAVGVEGKYT
jgi:hypothetical protein